MFRSATKTLLCAELGGGRTIRRVVPSGSKSERRSSARPSSSGFDESTGMPSPARPRGRDLTDRKITSVTNTDQGKGAASAASSLSKVFKSVVPHAAENLPIVGSTIKAIRSTEESGSSGGGGIYAKDGVDMPKEVLDIRRSAMETSDSILLARQPPKALNSTFGTGDRAPIVLAEKEEERRLARQHKNFDGLEVFNGGKLGDHHTFGRNMIFRDFIHHGLYNSKWGYYPKIWRKYKDLLTSYAADPIPFASLRGKDDYMTYVGLAQQSSPTFPTPGNIFQPYYGWVVAEYFVTVMRSKFDPSEPLIIYDIGAGTGTMAQNILDFLAEQYPEVYARCEYHVVELLPHVIPTLRSKLISHMNHCKIHHISILNWKELEPRRCFVMGLELLSCMPHDRCHRYEEAGDVGETWINFSNKDHLGSAFNKIYELTDPMCSRYLRYLRLMTEESFNAFQIWEATDGQEVIKQHAFSQFDVAGWDDDFIMGTKMLNLNNPNNVMYLPTAAMLMQETLAEFFPRHHAFFVDCSYVRGAIAGKNAPVMQLKTRVAKDVFLRVVKKDLYLHLGTLDICFPTNFNDLQVVYENICGKEKEITCLTHPDFWRNFGGDKIGLYTSYDGFNPLLDDFKQYSVFATHHPAEK